MIQFFTLIDVTL